MKVGELIKELQKFPEDLEIAQVDGEWPSYRDKIHLSEEEVYEYAPGWIRWCEIGDSPKVKVVVLR